MTYGYCPRCNAPATQRARNPIGPTTCANGHQFPHAETLNSPRYTGSTVKVVGRDESVVKHCSCRGCASRLEYTGRDVKSREVSDYTGDRDTVYFIDCPECAEKVTVRRF